MTNELSTALQAPKQGSISAPALSVECITSPQARTVASLKTTSTKKPRAASDENRQVSFDPQARTALGKRKMARCRAYLWDCEPLASWGVPN